jgi:hypothetical protein
MVVGDVIYYPGQEVGGGPALQPVRRASGTTRRVTEDHRTIQAAVDAARPGDLILVGPGVYREEVKVLNIGLLLDISPLTSGNTWPYSAESSARRRSQASTSSRR